MNLDEHQPISFQNILLIVAMLVGLASLSFWIINLMGDSQPTDGIDNPSISTTTEVVSSSTPRAVLYKVTYKTLKESNENSTIEIRYPFLSGDDGVLEIINSEINKYIKKASQQFKESSSPVDVKVGLSKSSLSIDVTEAITQGYISHSNTNTISIPFTVYEYMSGAAHPNSALIVLNYNLSTGEEITINEIFPASSSYLSTLSQKSRTSLSTYSVDGNKIDLDKSMLLAGTEPKKENFSNFQLDGNQLIIIFNPYQVAPYAVGVVKVGISI